MHRHIMICGEVQVGKSTLIQALLREIGRPVYGYNTKSLKRRSDGYHEIYMYAPGDIEHAQLIAECDTVHHKVNAELFNTLGVELLSKVRDDGIILMDEIGFMEQSSQLFTSRVIELLDGDIPVIGAVKARHPNCEYL